jgi:hypothetical protein
LPLSGTAAGNIGNAPIIGAASGLLGLTGAATGGVVASGIVAGTFSLDGIGVGVVRIVAASSGTLPLSGAGTALVRVSGIGGGSLPLVGAGAGTVGTASVSGTAVGSLLLGGTATGAVQVSGFAVAVFGITGSAAGSGPIQIAARFAFPGDPANGGKLVMSRQGGQSLAEVSMSTFYIKRGDTSPALRYAITPKSVVLTGASVQFQMRPRRPKGAAAVIDAAAVVVIATGTPTVEYGEWQAANITSPGLYQAEFRVTYADGSVETFPNDDFILVKISEDIR